MKTQDELFHEDWRDSLRHLVKALGGVDAVGVDLFPHKTRHSAGSWLSDCLNVERPAKLDLEEIEALLRMGREAGVHCGMYVLVDSIAYDRPHPTTPKSPMTVIRERQASLMSEFARLEREADRIDAAAALKAVK